MSACPNIAVYEIVPGELHRAGVAPWVARYVVPKRNPKTGAQWFDFLPMIFQGDSREAVETAAKRFWTDETAKIEARRAHAAGLSAARRKAVA